MAAEQPHVLLERHGHIATVTMNRPEARNAFGMEMLVRLADAWAEIDHDDDVRVAILTGAGGHFCAGSDLKAMAQGYGNDPWLERAKADPEVHWKGMLRAHRLKKPLIAAIEGTAVAGGTELIEGTDIRIAGTSAKLGLPEARWALFPLGGSTVRLPRQISYSNAMELLLTGKTITAQEAQAMGLIGRVVNDGEALAEAMKVAQQIAANGPLAVQAIKRAVQEAQGLPEREGLAKELEIGWPILATEDAKEGPRAFLEKRKAEFRGC
jgi:enoyl-CoA hydratase